MSERMVVKVLLCAVALCFIDGLFQCPVLRAMPRFMEWYDANPNAKSELRGKCTICHVANDGSGPLTRFGEAFANSGYRFTPKLRQAFPEFFAGGESSQSTPTTSAPSFDAKAFFAKNCSTCHGDDGTGGGVAPNVPDFTDASWQRSESDTTFVETIKNGKGLMPPWKEKLTDQQVQAMVKYVRRFAEGNTQE